MTKGLRAVCFAVFVCMALPAEAADEFEKSVVLSAKEVLPKNLLTGPHHTIDDKVDNDGYLNTYILRSKYGTSRVTGNALLAVRLNELRAIAEVDSYSTSKVFTGAVKKSGKAALIVPVHVAQSAAGMVKEPDKIVDTAKQVPAGVGRVFSWAAKKGKEGAASAKQVYEDIGDEEGDISSKEAVRRSLDAAKELGLDLIKYNARVREWYRKLRVDPYTTNPVLIDKVAYVARIETAVGLGFRFVPGMFALGIVGDVVGWYKRAEDLALYEDPDKLQLANRARLKEAGISDTAIDALMSNEKLSPGWRTFFIDGVSNLKGVEGLGDIVEAAALVKEEQGAIYYARTTTTLAKYHGSKSRFVSLVTGARIPSGVTADGLVVVPLAVDHLLWTENTAAVLRGYREQLTSKANPKAAEVLISGTASPRARDEVQRMGIVTVRERVQMSGLR